MVVPPLLVVCPLLVVPPPLCCREVGLPGGGLAAIGGAPCACTSTMDWMKKEAKT